MDLIAIIAALLLNASTGCDAMKADVMRVGGQDYLVQAWTCGDKDGKSHIWRTWQRECVASNGNKYFGRPYFLEIQGGFGAAIENAYVQLCGS